MTPGGLGVGCTKRAGVQPTWSRGRPRAMGSGFIAMLAPERNYVQVDGRIVFG